MKTARVGQDIRVGDLSRDIDNLIADNAGEHGVIFETVLRKKRKDVITKCGEMA